MSIQIDNMVLKLREQVAELEARLKATEATLAVLTAKPRRGRPRKEESCYAEIE